MKGEEEGERATKATCKWKEPLRKKMVFKSFGFLFRVFFSLILCSLSIFLSQVSQCISKPCPISQAMLYFLRTIAMVLRNLLLFLFNP